ncbi:DNA-binding response regulator [Candidatus Epulonipiscium fishelsonii]|uniref:DNA-binding response regulator n=1 Tax=Candidatus Epulonipiscium fishelsonii TaxID=77094 RepID=A0ACC8XGF1_9FIRM|nr:DNA-binding response regulator [Epulopiscium sp. SCG-B05WGA-EpuloA1]ONI42497.1 DNA-binding response regulator [Epulopiscium sp. SCG-B11WGA-EpuloA1]
MKKILIIDDDQNIAELLSLYLQKEGYETKEVYSGIAGIEAFNSYNPNLVLLDLMLPELDGYDVCKEIRKISKVPVIMLTAKGDVFDKVLGLELGADDYIAKPFDPKELIARVKAVLRRTTALPPENLANRIELENLIIDKNNYSIVYNDETLELPPKEFELFYFLASNQRQVFTREQLLEKIWSYDFMGDTRTVDVHIKRLRDKFKGEKSWEIKTVWGVGYKLERSY